MADTDDVDDEAVVEYLVDDPVVANPDAITTILAGEGDAPGRPRIVNQEVDGSPDSLLFTARKAGQGLDGPSSNLDSIDAQRSPSSALTSSQGT